MCCTDDLLAVLQIHTANACWRVSHTVKRRGNVITLPSGTEDVFVTFLTVFGCWGKL